MNVSVIITTYNRPHYLERVIEGYLRQSHPPDELVIADDGSTDDTALVVKRIAGGAGFEISHVWHEDMGFRAGWIRNRAIAGCRGDYLIVCDDDSIPCRTMVSDHLRYAEEGCFIQGHRVLLGADASDSFTCGDISMLNLLRLSVKGEARNVMNSLRMPVPVIKRSQDLKGIRTCNISLHKKDIIAVNGFNEDFVGWGKEDSELVARLYKYGLKRKDLKFRACCYHLHHGNYDRYNVDRNVALLEDTMEGDDYFCANGIDKYL